MQLANTPKLAITSSLHENLAEAIKVDDNASGELLQDGPYAVFSDAQVAIIDDHKNVLKTKHFSIAETHNIFIKVVATSDVPCASQSSNASASQGHQMDILLARENITYEQIRRTYVVACCTD